MLPTSSTRCLTPVRVLEDPSLPRSANPSDPKVGAIIGNLSILQKIGGGGMGTVYEAHHRHLDRRVAIKFLKQDDERSSDAALRFEREYRSLAQIDHPNVLRALDAGQWLGDRYLVTEWLDGLDLHRYIEQFGPVEPGTAMEWIRQAALGLQAAHQQGLIHRDVKPSNLFLGQQTLIKLIDFGIVRLSHSEISSTQNGQFLGTVDYLSPEQATAPNSVTAACDIYSLGCVWIYLLSGKPPFADDLYPGFMPKLKGHMADTPPWLDSSESKRLPAGMRELLHGMVSKQPENRPSSAAEVARRIESLSNPMSIPHGMSQYRIASRYRIAGLLTAAIGLVGLAVVAFASMGSPLSVVESNAKQSAPNFVSTNSSEVETVEQPTSHENRSASGVQTVRSQVRSVKVNPHSSKSTWSGLPHTSLQESSE